MYVDFFFYPCFLLIQFFTEDWSTTGLLYFDMKICRRHCNAQESCSCKEISILTFLRMWFQFSKPPHFPPSFEHISITLCVLYLTKKSLCVFRKPRVFSNHHYIWFCIYLTENTPVVILDSTSMFNSLFLCSFV